MTNLTGRDSGQRGQALVLFVLAFGVLGGMMALAIDVGMLYYQRRSLQNAADAAALAAVQELPNNPGSAVNRAHQWVAKNGFGSGDGAVVQATTPYKGNTGSIEVTVKKEMPALFARLLGRKSFSVGARAVASRSVGPGGGPAILVLDPSLCGAFEKDGAAKLEVTNGGGIVVNSQCGRGMVFGGSGPVQAGSIYHYYKGGWVQSGSGPISPTPEPMVERIGDPLADLIPPDLALLGMSPDSGGTPVAPRTRKVETGATTLRPGVYYGGISIERSANVSFEPGIYVLAGGGLSLTGSGVIRGQGVFFYNTSDPVNSSGDGACKSVNLRGSADFYLEAPTSGPYEDILFWQDVACTAVFSHSGSGDTTAGVIYVPGAEFRMSGTADLGGKQIIAKEFTASGVSSITVNYKEFVPVTYGPVKLVE